MTFLTLLSGDTNSFLFIKCSMSASHSGDTNSSLLNDGMHVAHSSYGKGLSRIATLGALVRCSENMALHNQGIH